MTKNLKKSLIIITIIAVVATIVLFKIFAGLPYLRLPFIGVLFFYGFNFLVAIIDYYPMCEIVEEEQLAQGEERKFKNDGTFIIEFILVMIILLAATTAVLVTMLFRQTEMYDVSFWEQLGVVFGGYVAILFSRLIFSIGETQTVRRSMPTCLTQEAYQRNAASPKRNAPWWENEYFDAESLNEAKEAVVNILQEKLGVRREECVMSADLMRDLGADDLDFVELFMEYDKYLEHNYTEINIFFSVFIVNERTFSRNDRQRKSRVSICDIFLINILNIHHCFITPLSVYRNLFKISFIGNDHRTRTFIGQHFDQDRVRNSAVHNKYFFHAVIDGIDAAFHLRDHTTGDDTFIKKSCRIADINHRDQRRRIILVTQNTGYVRHCYESVCRECACDICRRCVSVDVVDISCVIASDSRYDRDIVFLQNIYDRSNIHIGNFTYIAESLVLHLRLYHMTVKA